VPDLANPSNPQSLTPNPSTHPLYACLYLPPGSDQPASSSSTLIDIAQQFSPRYERHRDDVVSVDVSGLERLLGPGRVIGEELRREATARGVRLHVAIAGTRMAALLLALARPGLTIVEPGGEAEALAPIAVGILATLNSQVSTFSAERSELSLETLQRWGLRTLGELTSLPAADLVARFGRPAMTWQAIARGEDIGPLVPTLESERFESSLDLEWPIEGLEPLSFVLTRLLEPLSTRLERRDRGAAVLHILLRLVTRDASGTGWEEHARRLQLPTPMRDVRTLRTLALLDLESHPPASAIDRVRIVIDPTPGRVLQHTLFARAQPTPEQLSTLVARLGALLGQDRFGAPALVDTYRPGAFAMAAFKTDHDESNRSRLRAEGASASLAEARGQRSRAEAGERGDRRENIFSALSADSAVNCFEQQAPSPQPLVSSALRRCRYPVPARVVVAEGRPVRVTTDRRGFAGGAVTCCAGPWRTSGDWWAGLAGAGQAGQAGQAGRAGRETPEVRSVPPVQPIPPIQPLWNRDEWDVALNDGAVYRIFQDRVTDAWFIDAIVD